MGESMEKATIERNHEHKFHFSYEVEGLLSLCDEWKGYEFFDGAKKVRIETVDQIIGLLNRFRDNGKIFVSDCPNPREDGSCSCT